jgi:hypothetical protein
MTTENENRDTIKEEKMVDENQAPAATIDEFGKVRFPNRSKEMLAEIMAVRSQAMQEAKEFSEEEIRALPLQVIQDILARLSFGDRPLTESETQDYEAALDARTYANIRRKFPELIEAM